MASAVGSQAGRNPHGVTVRDIRDFGAVQGNNSVDNGPAIQAAYDSLASTGGVVFIPAGTWYVATPVWCDAPNITFQGEGVGASILIAAPGQVPPAFLFSFYRSEKWNSSLNDNTYIPPAAPYLGNVTTASSTTTFTSSSLSSSSNLYAGMTLTFLSGVCNGQSATISSYTPSTQTVVLATPLSATPGANDQFEIYWGYSWTNGSPTVTTSAQSVPIPLVPGAKVKLGTGTTVYTVQSVGLKSFTLTSNVTDATGVGYLNRGTSPTVPSTQVFAADHKLDAYGKLDTSIAPSAGRAWGFRTFSASSGSPYADHHVAFWGVPPQIGNADGWQNVNRFTLDLAIEGPPTYGSATGGRIIGSPLCGMGRVTAPDPWFLQVGYGFGGNTLPFQFTFATSDGTARRQFEFGDVSTLTGVVRLSIMLDFTTASSGGAYDPNGSGLCVIRAWINGKEQVITRDAGTQSGGNFAPSSNLTFARNRVFPFVFGTNNGMGYWLDPNGGALDPSLRGMFTVYGFQVTGSADYTSDASGNQQVSAAGAAGANGVAAGASPNDLYRYIGSGYAGQRKTGSRFTYYLSSDAPLAAGAPAMSSVRMASVYNSTVGCLGIFVPEISDLSNSPPGQVSWRGLTLENFGTSVTIGPGYYPSLYDFEALGGWYGVASAAGMGACYDVSVDRVHLQGTDAGYFGRSQLVTISHWKREGVGACAIRLDGCNADLRDIQTAQNTPGVTTALIDLPFTSDYASWTRVSYLSGDDETGHVVPIVYCEKHSQGTALELDGVTCDSSSSVPLVILNDKTGSSSLGRMTLRGPLFLSRPGVQVTGNWGGAIQGFDTGVASGTKPLWTTDGSQPKIACTIDLDAVPTSGTWSAGTVVRLRTPSLTTGATTSYICTASGSPGTWVPCSVVGGGSGGGSGGGPSARPVTFLLAADGSNLQVGTNLTKVGALMASSGTLTNWAIQAAANSGGFAVVVNKNGSAVLTQTVADGVTAVQTGTLNVPYVVGDTFTIDCTNNDVSGAGSGVQYINVTLD